MTTWYLVRLELGRTEDNPEGSALHGYLLRLPLGDDGLIDKDAVASDPAKAAVRRFAPDEADRVGYVLRKGKGWAFSYALGDDDDEALYHLESHPLQVGNYVTITEPDGDRLPFRVVDVDRDGTTD